MTPKEKFTNDGFSVINTASNENKLLAFIKEHYPNLIQDNELNLTELKAVLGLPIDEKTNGYGLNFVGRNVARAKYAQKTDKELRLNPTLSQDMDTTQNLVLKGDNLDSLKILKNYYNGQIKCIYIDPPYNTNSDEFVYPDKFDKEEAEILGLANLSQDDFDRMEFSFRSKKSHNGWLTFMYPRLLIARDLLSKDGVIFISIDDNEQANLKTLCDEIFGEENFLANIIWERAFAPINLMKHFSQSHDFCLVYAKNIEIAENNGFKRTHKTNNRYQNPDNDPRGVWSSSDISVGPAIEANIYTITTPSGRKIKPPVGRSWRLSEKSFSERLADNRIWFGLDGNGVPRIKRFASELKKEGITPMTIWKHTGVGHSQEATKTLKELFDGVIIFDYPKPINYIKRMLELYTDSNSTILDFFAGSGTTGEAVMQLNAEDGGNRRFILCQIDEPIKKDKPAYQFCLDNGLPPVLSSITVERLRRAGERIITKKKSESAPTSEHTTDLSTDEGEQKNEKKHTIDIGFKVFDSIAAPKLVLDGEQIVIKHNNNDSLSRIYNMIFSIGIDAPTQVPETVVANCIYRIGMNYYLTNCDQISTDDFWAAIKNGNVFIDGWAASLNGTLQHYREKVKIVF